MRYASLFDEEVRLHNERFRAAASVGPRDRVLDIGCGTGLSTREAGRAAVHGSALGVDISAPALELARRLTEQEGLSNVSYLEADAQAHPWPPASFDLCISRFGAMFFADPAIAFAGIGAALRPGARLVLLVWQDIDRNEWASAIRQALGAGSAMRADAFSLADPDRVEALLAPGFTDLAFTKVDEPVFYGPDASTACGLVLGLLSVRDFVATLDAAQAGQALQRLRSVVASHDTGAGVYFGSRAWIITARRRR